MDISNYHINKTLNEMFYELDKASPIYQPSKFWRDLNKIHIEQLSTEGLDNFKRSINMKYFNWDIFGIIRHQLRSMFAELFRGNFRPLFRSKFINRRNTVRGLKNFNFFSAAIYNIYVAFLFDYVSRGDKLGILGKIEEPMIGNPFIIKCKDRLISQDLCNSVHEFYSIVDGVKDKKNYSVAEIGAGYGRLAHIFLSTLKDSSYCIIDIPPALYVAQEYLSRIFPGEKIFYFRPFESFTEIKEEFEASRIRFIMAHQIKKIPTKYFNVVVSISSFHEMTREQIKNYFNQIDRTCKDCFYTKQWRKSRTKDNAYIKENEYSVPANWQILYERRHPIQRMFFEALYNIG